MGYNSTMIFRVNSVILYVPVQMLMTGASAKGFDAANGFEPATSVSGAECSTD